MTDTSPEIAELVRARRMALSGPFTETTERFPPGLSQSRERPARQHTPALNFGRSQKPTPHSKGGSPIIS